MAALEDQLTIETDFFEHREVKPHFINDCCFGEDFAAWLRPKLADLASDGFTVGESIQEDYGWGFWVRRGKESIWIALSYAGDGPIEEPAQWVISISYDAGLNLIQRLFHKPDATAFSTVRDRIFAALKSTDGIKVIEQ
jgi:hypothetical protein